MNWFSCYDYILMPEDFQKEVLWYLANIYWITRMTQDRLERKQEEVLVTELVEVIKRYNNDYYSNSAIAAKIQEKFRIYKR